MYKRQDKALLLCADLCGTVTEKLFVTVTVTFLNAHKNDLVYQFSDILAKISLIDLGLNQIHTKLLVWCEMTEAFYLSRSCTMI